MMHLLVAFDLDYVGLHIIYILTMLMLCPDRRCGRFGKWKKV